MYIRISNSKIKNFINNWLTHNKERGSSVQRRQNQKQGTTGVTEKIGTDRQHIKIYPTSFILH
jgi:hypothetical protein